MPFYTRGGDTGKTDLLGERVTKTDPRIELIGELDETTSSIGVARSLGIDPRLNEWCIQIQRDSHRIMAELAFTDELRPAEYDFEPERTIWLEQQTDQIESDVDLPPEFVLPGDTTSGATFDLARTVTRRTERLAVGLAEDELVTNLEIVRYLNRLSSFLFIAARREDQLAAGASTKARG